MYKVCRADISEAGVLEEIHSISRKIAYRGIVPDSINRKCITNTSNLVFSQF